MSLGNIKDVLSREEMKMILAGTRPGGENCTTYCKDEANNVLGTVMSNSCPGSCAAYPDAAFSVCTCVS